MLESVERLFKAVSDKTRLRILCLLERGPLCVCQVVSVLGLSQSTVSKHLAILKNAGFVVDEKRGRWSYYELCKAKDASRVSKVLTLVLAVGNGDGLVKKDRRRLHRDLLKAGKMEMPMCTALTRSKG